MTTYHHTSHRSVEFFGSIAIRASCIPITHCNRVWRTECILLLFAQSPAIVDAKQERNICSSEKRLKLVLDVSHRDCVPCHLQRAHSLTSHISHSSFPYRFHRRLLLLLKLNYSDKVWYAYCLAIGTLTLCCNNSPVRIDLVLWVHRRPSATVVHVISRFFPLKTTLCRNSKSNFIHEKANLVFAPSQTAPRLWPFGLIFFCVCILLRWSNTHTETRVDAASWQCAANPCCGIHFFSSLLIFSCLSLHSFCLLRMHLLCQPVSCCGQVVYCMGLAPNSQFLR